MDSRAAFTRAAMSCSFGGSEAAFSLAGSEKRGVRCGEAVPMMKTRQQNKGSPMKQSRLTYAESIRRIQTPGLGFLGPDEEPLIPDEMPQPEDEEVVGLRFFRTLVGDGADLSNLGIPRTFFGRSEISNASFRNTELSESNLRWNDFIDVNFTDATLARADLRSSKYIRVNFTRADLRGADMRRASFEDCIFESAVMDDAILTHKQGSRLSLSSEQKASIDWRDEDGPEPSGG